MKNKCATLYFSGIKNWNLLEELNLSGNILESLVEQIFDLPNLVNLRAHSNNIIKIPKIGDLKKLKVGEFYLKI